MTMASTSTKGRARSLRFILRDWGGRIGFVLLFIVAFISFWGPVLAPHGGNETIGLPGQAPTGSFLFGLDFLGRDVLSRTLDGGFSTVSLGVIATLLTYFVGMTTGLVAGYTRSVIDPILMRTVDLFISFPALLIMLLFVTAFGGGPVILVFAVVLVLFPGVSRIVRTATLEVSTRGYVEAAVARGERTPSILRREILPNISSPIIADVGIRFSWSIILIASVNYLGLGLQPPSANWGLMISENQVVSSSNPLALLAPAALLGLLVISVNLIGDAFARQLGQSGLDR
jgi:peptide/nickel transport system permease protein